MCMSVDRHTPCSLPLSECSPTDGPRLNLCPAGNFIELGSLLYKNNNNDDGGGGGDWHVAS
jgi:hypothetical protein